MLVLSRRVNEAVLIGRNVRVLPIDIRGDKVRLGVVAPPSWPVHREEVADSMLQRGQTLSDPLEAALQLVAELRKENEELKAKLQVA